MDFSPHCNMFLFQNESAFVWIWWNVYLYDRISVTVFHQCFYFICIKNCCEPFYWQRSLSAPVVVELLKVLYCDTRIWLEGGALHSPLLTIVISPAIVNIIQSPSISHHPFKSKLSHNSLRILWTCYSVYAIYRIYCFNSIWTSQCMRHTTGGCFLCATKRFCIMPLDDV